MMNQNEKFELIKKMQNDSGMEMSTNDLEKLLEEELAKPEADMDVALIAELLELLEDETAAEQAMHTEQIKQSEQVMHVKQAMQSEQAVQASWKRLEKTLAARKVKSKAFTALKRLGQVAACFVLLLALAYGVLNTARAYNWRFLLKLFEPLAETFQLYTNNQEEPDAPVVMQNADAVYSDMATDIQSITFATLEEFPDEYDGYWVKPVGMPERFQFLQGTLYADINMSKLSSYYMSEQGICVWTVTHVTEDGTVAGFEFEKTKESKEADYVDGVLINYYVNSDNQTVSASWVVDMVHYSMTGALTREEITVIIEKMFEQEKTT